VFAQVSAGDRMFTRGYIAGTPYYLENGKGFGNEEYWEELWFSVPGMRVTRAKIGLFAANLGSHSTIVTKTYENPNCDAQGCVLPISPI
jgi:hypothetical protein